MADYTYTFAEFVNAPLGPAFNKLETETEPLGFVDGMVFDYGNEAVLIRTDHDLTTNEKTDLDNVVAAHTGLPDTEPFRACCLPVYATAAELPSDAEMQDHYGPCIVLIETPLQLAAWHGTWSFMPFP